MTEPSSPAARKVDHTRVEMTQVVMPQATNPLGNAFGGQIMAWVDICAAVAAGRLCRTPVVTASIDAVHFLSPVRLGHVVILRAQVNATFQTSMECGVSVFAEDPLTGEVHKAAKAYATFVSLDADGKPQPVPELILESGEDQRRAADAAKRRAHRLEIRREENKKRAAREAV